jgi:hypothetical protein
MDPAPDLSFGDLGEEPLEALSEQNGLRVLTTFRSFQQCDIPSVISTVRLRSSASR